MKIYEKICHGRTSPWKDEYTPEWRGYGDWQSPSDSDEGIPEENGDVKKRVVFGGKSISSLFGNIFSRPLDSEDILLLGLIALMIFNKCDDEIIILLALLFLSGIIDF